MKLPRDLNGDELAEHLVKNWDYLRVHQAGSHIILDTEIPAHQRISIPSHKPLRTGTLNKILSLIANHKGVTKEELLRKI